MYIYPSLWYPLFILFTFCKCFYNKKLVQKKSTDVQSCNIVTTFYFEDLDRNVESEKYNICLSNVVKLKL